MPDVGRHRTSAYKTETRSLHFIISHWMCNFYDTYQHCAPQSQNQGLLGWVWRIGGPYTALRRGQQLC